jgi:hypothetical protein
VNVFHEKASMKSIDVEAEFGAYLSSRVTAACLRQQIECSAEEEHVVLIDMRNVESMSEGFADEAFAILVVAHGAGWFKQRIQLQGVKPFVRDTILTAILERRARIAPSAG